VLGNCDCHPVYHRRQQAHGPTLPEPVGVSLITGSGPDIWPDAGPTANYSEQSRLLLSSGRTAPRGRRRVQMRQLNSASPRAPDWTRGERAPVPGRGRPTECCSAQVARIAGV
jgi:hypothetical protein